MTSFSALVSSCGGLTGTQHAVRPRFTAWRPQRAPLSARPAVSPRITASRKLSAQAVVVEQVSAPIAINGDVPAFLHDAAQQILSVSDPRERAAVLLRFAKRLPPLPESLRTDANRVMGCTTQAWIAADLTSAGRVRFQGDSDSELTRGLCAVLVEGLSGLTPQQVLEVPPEALTAFQLGESALTKSRANGFLNILEATKKRAHMLTSDLPRFPSLLITAEGANAQGAFAEAQARFLRPDPAHVDALVAALSEKKVGVVAHFYMDPEVQGVLSSAAERWPHIHISDSLVMADSAVRMAEAGCKTVVVLGVDFMSENVRAILDQAGHKNVGVYRMSAEHIGCSLAEAAESAAYNSFLQRASGVPNSLHVVYINTSLLTKATAHGTVPTITCTSSNVVQTVLQAFAQIPDANVWYGPDTYMGRNLATLFASLATLPDEQVRALHPDHTQESVRALLPRLRHFQEGTCIVHHLFGGETCELVRTGYRDAYLAAHFEVPGEMFAAAQEARTRGMGVVGSTQNILDFIVARTKEALSRPHAERLQFVLGTEVGMVTAIVRRVQAMLAEAGRSDIGVEIVFPVSPEAVTTDKQTTSANGASNGASNGANGAARRSVVEFPPGLSIVPGPASGEGCSMEGGCASCPYMKMNSLSALMSVLDRLGSPVGEALLSAFQPRPYAEQVGGRSIAQAGCEPILHMRAFQQTKRLPDALVNDILTRNRG